MIDILLVILTFYICGVISAFVLWYGRFRYYYSGFLNTPLKEIMPVLVILSSWLMVLISFRQMVKGKTRIEFRR